MERFDETDIDDIVVAQIQRCQTHQQGNRLERRKIRLDLIDDRERFDGLQIRISEIGIISIDRAKFLKFLAKRRDDESFFGREIIIIKKNIIHEIFDLERPIAESDDGKTKIIFDSDQFVDFKNSARERNRVVPLHRNRQGGGPQGINLAKIQFIKVDRTQNGRITDINPIRV